jgi:uncharacterized protein (TIGR02118 family)
LPQRPLPTMHGMHRLTIQYDDPQDPETFDALYFGEHVPLVKLVPAVLEASYSKPHVLGSGPGPYLVAELDFHCEKGLEIALRSPEMAAVARHAEGLPARRVMFTGDVTQEPGLGPT